MNVSEFLHGIATAAGIETDNPALKLILADGNLAGIQVPAEFDKLVTNKYKDMVTIEAAKNHPDLKKHFYATSLFGIDKDIEKLARENTFSDDEIATLKKVENTQKRLEELFKMSKDKFEKKTPPNDEEKHKKLTQTIADLNKSILDKDAEKEKMLKETKQQYLNSLRDRTKKELFQKYEYTDALPKNVQVQAAQALFDNKLKENNYKVIFNEDGDSLSLFTDQDTEVFINNKPVNVHQYVESLLAENKLLKINTTPQAGSNGKPKEPILVMHQQNGKVDNSNYLREVEASLRDLANKS